jgi:hypothetical protein
MLSRMGNPAELLRRVFDSYGICVSYVDAGEVVRVFHTARGRRETRLPFHTLFARPDRFRYQFTNTDMDSEYVVWTEEDDALSWWSLRPEVTRSESITHALAGPTGISGGSAFEVPSLLLQISPFESSWLAHKFAAAEDAGREVIDGIETIKLHLVNPNQEFEDPPVLPADLLKRVTANGGPPLPKLAPTRWEWRSLWIADADATIRRKAERINFGAHVSEATTTWRPQMNQTIDSARFGFLPPNTATPT